MSVRQATHASFEYPRPAKWAGAFAAGEGFRQRRPEWGQHHHVSGQYLAAYTGEMAWREDHRRVTNAEMFHAVIAASMARPVSPDVEGVMVAGGSLVLAREIRVTMSVRDSRVHVAGVS